MQATARRSGLALATLCATLLVASGCGYPSAGRSACADLVLEEWTRGALQPTHPAGCYDAAIDALPEDLRSYTSAADDISRMGMAASRAEPTRRLASAPVADTGVRSVPVELAILVTLSAALATTGIATALLRRRRSR